MCDTFCLPQNYSEDGICYFAKNSDRSPNEPHLVIHVPAENHPVGSAVSCTYISIPQVKHTRGMILFKPSWLWGAEMGVNEKRVAIGNEAVFTRVKRGPAALTGMDLLRLALERADTASAAVEVMIELLETYGQGGNCGFDHDFYYDNSFLVADPEEVYIMETAGKNYAVKQGRDKCAISNRLTIGTEHSARSGIGADENFAKRFTEPVYSHFSGARERRQCVCDALSPSLGAAGLISILRSHEPGVEGREFTRGSVKSVCMHAGGLIGDHSTGSLVAVLRKDKPVTLWCTGASTPCISAFKPVFWDPKAAEGTDAARPNAAWEAPVFSDPVRSREYWLKREYLHRAVISGAVDPASLRSRIKTLEAAWQSRERQLMGEAAPDAAKLQSLSHDAGVQEQALIDELSVPDWRNLKRRGRYAAYWQKKNDALGQAQNKNMKQP